MAEQLTTSAEALRLFFTDDIYLVKSETSAAVVLPAGQAADVHIAGQDAQKSEASNASLPLKMPAVPASASASASAPAPMPVQAPAAQTMSAPSHSPATPTAPETVFKYLGKNQKNVLILVHDGENDVSSESGRELLRNLVKAMQLTANDFALINYYHYSHVRFEELSKFFGSKLLLGFGVSPVQLGLADQPQHTIGTQGMVKLVFTGRLDLLADDQEGKKKLWGSLKQFKF